MDKILKWCGFRQRSDEGWVDPEGFGTGWAKHPPPRLDMNFLFKYVVPKLESKTLMMETYDGGYDFCILSENQSGGLWNGNAKDPVEAWKEALLKLIESKE